MWQQAHAPTGRQGLQRQPDNVWACRQPVECQHRRQASVFWLLHWPAGHLVFLLPIHTCTKPTTEHAVLLTPGVCGAQVAEWGPKLEGIVEWFGQLQEVDVEGVPPALRADVEGQSSLRADQPRRYAGQEEMLQQAPDREGAFVRVPKIATAADG